MAHWRDNTPPGTKIIQVLYEGKEYYVMLNWPAELVRESRPAVKREIKVSLNMSGLRPT